MSEGEISPIWSNAFITERNAQLDKLASVLSTSSGTLTRPEVGNTYPYSANPPIKNGCFSMLSYMYMRLLMHKYGCLAWVHWKQWPQ